MGRLGYLVLLTLLLAGGLYVFWPESTQVEDPQLWRGETPSRFRLVSGGRVQEVDGTRLTIDGIELPLDPERSRGLWDYIRTLTINERVATRVAEDQLTSYGIDATRELSGGTLRLRWNASGAQRYLWEGGTGRLLPCEPALSQRLERLAGRLDRAMLIDLPQVHEVAVDGLKLRLEGGFWRDVLLAERPDFDRRINRLYDLLERFRLNDLTRREVPSTKPDHVIGLTPKDVGQPTHEVRLWPRDGGGMLQVDALPVQPLSTAEFTTWTQVLDSFRGDYLFNLEAEFALRPLGEVQVRDGETLRFRLEKHGLNDVNEGRSQWDVVWPGGREAASENAAPAIALALDELAVREVRRRRPGEQPPAGARRLTFVFHIDHRTLEVALAGDQVFSPTHVATAVMLPEFLQRLTPDDMLDHVLTLRGAERVVKVQRQWHRGPQAGRSEVVAVSAGTGGTDGVWQQTWPKNSVGTRVSALAVDRLARTFCNARSQAVRLPTAADRAALTDPEFELDVRFAQAQVRLSNDHTRLADTTDQDLGFAFVREGERWRAIEKESGISHLVDNDLVELLQAPLNDDLVLPLVPSLITRIEVDGPAGHYALIRSGEDWQARLLDGAGRGQGDLQVADAIEVRRFLRQLTTLRAKRSEPDAGRIPPDQRVGVVRCVFPGAGESNAEVVLSLGRADGDLMPTAIDAGGLRGMPHGRAFLSASERDGLLPPFTRFVAAPAPKPAP